MIKFFESIPKEQMKEEDKKYLLGKENWLIRMYSYLNAGVGILNNFRNLFLGIFALYIILKLDNYFWLVAMAVPSVIILTLIGRYNTHTLSKVLEWLGMRFSTHYGIKTFDFNEKQTELLQQIKDLLEKSAKE